MKRLMSDGYSIFSKCSSEVICISDVYIQYYMIIYIALEKNRLQLLYE